MRRLLLLNTDLEIGGTPTVVRELARRLRDEATQIEVASLKTPGPIGASLQEAGVEVHALCASSPAHLPRTVARLRTLIHERRIDTVLSFLAHGNLIAAMASRRLPDVRWFQSIQTTQPRPSWHWLAQQWASRRCERVIVPSESIARVAHERSSIDRSRIEVIPNAVDVERFVRPDQRGTGVPPVLNVHHGRDGHATGAFRVGFVGRLDPVKRVEDLIGAIEQLPNEVTLDLWGDGSERARLEGLVGTRNDLRRRITFHGVVAEPSRAYHVIDCLVLPSDAEGFGLVLIEAMAAGVPVIGTNVDGIRDVVRHESNGLLVPPRSPQAIARAIERLRGDAELRARLVEQGERDVQSFYAWPAVIARYRQVLGLT